MTVARPGRVPRLGAGLPALVSLALAAAASASTSMLHFTPWRGGAPPSGAALVRAACPERMVLVGASGRAGAAIEAIDAVLCVPIMADGKWSGATPVRVAVAAQAAGGGAGFAIQCSRDQVAAGFSGRGSGSVESLALRCGALAQDAEGRVALAGATAATAPAGTGSGAAFAEECPPGQLASMIEAARPASGATLQALRLGCSTPHPQRYGVESLMLGKDRLRPGESTTLTITLRGPAGAAHSMVIHQPAHVTPAEFRAIPGWTVTVPPRQRSVTVTIEASVNASPAFGGPYVDLRPDYDAATPTRRLSVVGPGPGK